MSDVIFGSSDASAISGAASALGKKPWVTWGAAVLSTATFIGILVTGAGKSWDSLSLWGYVPATAVWDGKIWGLLTSVFVHLDPLHLFFNLYWLFVLGKPMELAIGSPRFAAFFVSAAAVSSGLELATGSTGYGLSGVGYAIFGFVWLSRKRHESFEKVLTNRTKWLFLYWLVGCVIATRLWNVPIGNAAHFSGLAFGAAVSQVGPGRWRKVAVSATFALAALAVLPVFWCPWSVSWVEHSAFKAHSRGEFALAERQYRRSLQLGADPIWVWQNLALVYAGMDRKDDFEAALRELRRLDPKGVEPVEQELARWREEKKNGRAP